MKRLNVLLLLAAVAAISVLPQNAAAQVDEFDFITDTLKNGHYEFNCESYAEELNDSLGARYGLCCKYTGDSIGVKLYFSMTNMPGELKRFLAVTNAVRTCRLSITLSNGETFALEHYDSQDIKRDYSTTLLLFGFYDTEFYFDMGSAVSSSKGEANGAADVVYRYSQFALHDIKRITVQGGGKSASLEVTHPTAATLKAMFRKIGDTINQHNWYDYSAWSGTGKYAKAEPEPYIYVENAGTFERTVAAGSGTTAFSVNTNRTDYTVTGTASWCRLEYRSDYGFSIVWDANNSSSQRTAEFILRAGDKTATVRVVQQAGGSVVTIQNVWVDYNVRNGAWVGMMIHVKFTASGMLNRTGNCNAYFYFSDGTALKDFNRAYYTRDGHVSVGDSFTPVYESAVFNDFRLFIPYAELHLAQGVHNLKFNVELFEGNRSLARSQDVFFSVTM